MITIIQSITAFCASILRLLSFASDLDDPNEEDAVLISGCDTGIGLELAKYFHKTTNLKLICCFLSPGKSEGFKELSHISQRDGICRLFLKKLDLRSSEDIDLIVQFIETAKEQGVFKRLKALINNAGILTYGEFDWLTWDHISSQIEVNLVGTIRLTRAIVPYIIESRGRIVNVSSVNDSTVFPGLSIYSATKSALSTFSRGLGYELRKFGAHVVTIRLGDFARLTSIMSRHKTNQSDMWNEMSSRKQLMYKDFFHQFNKHLLENYGMTSPQEFAHSPLFNDFRRAILSRRPPTTITCAPIHFRIFYFVIELMPVRLQYYLLDILIQVGFNWKPPQIVI